MRRIDKVNNYVKLAHKILKSKHLPPKTKKRLSNLLIKRINALLKMKTAPKQKILKIVDVQKPRTKFTRDESKYIKEQAYPKEEMNRENLLQPIPYDSNLAVTQLVKNRQEGQIELQKEARAFERQLADLRVQMAQQQSQQQAQGQQQKTEVTFNIDKEEKRLDKQNEELLNQLEILKKEQIVTDQLLITDLKPEEREKIIQEQERINETIDVVKEDIKGNEEQQIDLEIIKKKGKYAKTLKEEKNVDKLEKLF